MPINFDALIERRGTHSEKWDFLTSVFGTDDVLPMWVADMDFLSPPPVVEEMINVAKRGLYSYTGRGDSLYEAIVSWMKKQHQWTIQKQWISFSPGVVSALSSCVQTYTRPGDKIVIQTPVYAPFFKVITNNGRELVINELKKIAGHYEMDFEQLENSLDEKTKMMILCSPHNPVGRVWTKAELSRLGEICFKRDIIIVSDEIHHDLVFPSFQHTPLAAISPEFERQTIVCTSPSKTFNIAGLASSIVIIPNRDLKRRFDATVFSQGIGEGNLFGIVGMEAAYRHGAEWRKELIAYLQDNLNYLETYLKDELPQIKWIRPEATYLAWLDFSFLGMDQETLFNFITHKAKVGLCNGTIFGEKEGVNFLRLNFGCPRLLLTEGLERLKKAIVPYQNI